MQSLFVSSSDGDNGFIFEKKQKETQDFRSFYWKLFSLINRGMFIKDRVAKRNNAVYELKPMLSVCKTYSKSCIRVARFSIVYHLYIRFKAVPKI